MYPKKHTLELLESENRNWKSLILDSCIFILLSSIFAGVVLMFYMMYPEVFIVPNAEHTGRLFVYAAASPLFIFAMFGLGIILVVIFDVLIQGSLSFWITKRAFVTNGRIAELSYSRFIAMYLFTHVFPTIFYMITVLWMFFFEKFAYTKIFFPVTDITLPVAIHFGLLFVLLVMKWIWEIQIKKALFQWGKIPTLEMRESIVISFCIRLGLNALLIMVIYFSGNLIAGAQWS